jgi:hypothetical protein
MTKKALGVVAGLAVWMIVATIAGLIMRNAWPAYAAVADSMTFTMPMMITRLSIGVVATVLAGWVAAGITRGSTMATLLTGVILLLAFIPEHISIWDKFPVWYHLTFLGSLVPLTLLGGRWPAMKDAPS